MVHTLRQLFPSAPHGTERRERGADARHSSGRQQTRTRYQISCGGWRRRKEKREEVRKKKEKKDRENKKRNRKQESERERRELTVKARASSPELSVGSPVSGYHTV